MCYLKITYASCNFLATPGLFSWSWGVLPMGKGVKE